MNFIISSSFLQWPPQNMSNGAKKLKFKISLIFHKKDYSMSNLEQSKVQGNLKRQIQHTLDPGLFSSSLVMMVQPLLWAWKGVRCKKPLDNYIIDYRFCLALGFYQPRSGWVLRYCAWSFLRRFANFCFSAMVTSYLSLIIGPIVNILQKFKLLNNLVQILQVLFSTFAKVQLIWIWACTKWLCGV